MLSARGDEARRAQVTGFVQVREFLDDAVGGPAATVAGPHGDFWRTLTRDQFVAFAVFGFPVVTVGDGANSTIVKALRGQAPFGADTGTAGAQFRRMPAGRPAMPDERIVQIVSWIDDGCPDDDVTPVDNIEATLNGAASGEGFVLVGIPTILRIRTTDGSTEQVSVRVGQANGAGLTVSPGSVSASGEGVEVQLLAASTSAAPNDTVVEIVHGATTTSFQLTAIAEPTLRFAGRFQCRLATDPDPWDSPWGEQSSFGVYAVQGPDPANPDEPPLDRIVRFQDGVALRPFCAPIGVVVVAIEANVGGTVISFAKGDPLIGLPVRLGPNCKFDGRNRTFAPDGFEPISDFRVEVGTVLAGASAAAEPRATPQDPPGSTAPYADGISQLGVDPTPWQPSDLGYQESTWEGHAWALVARKLALLVAQQPADEREARIRTRRLGAHAADRLGAIGFPIQLMERYTGLVDRDVVVDDGATGALAYLEGLPAIQFQASFFDFDTDCQTGTVIGTLSAPASVAAPPNQVRGLSPLRRTAPGDPPG